MNQALAFYAIRTVPGFPLGQPVDGRERYGMTAEQAHAYCWLVKNRPHDKPFCLNFRDAAWSLHRHPGRTHAVISALVERGWIQKIDAPNSRAVTYAFVHPVMTFKVPRHA
jgi:DNA-binding MarR family transcriptional regulator